METFVVIYGEDIVLYTTHDVKAVKSVHFIGQNVSRERCIFCRYTTPRENIQLVFLYCVQISCCVSSSAKICMLKCAPPIYHVIREMRNMFRFVKTSVQRVFCGRQHFTHAFDHTYYVIVLITFCAYEHACQNTSVSLLFVNIFVFI